MSYLAREYVEVQEEAIKIPVKQLGELSQLPKCVEILRMMTPPDREKVVDADQWAYVVVRSPYAQILRPGMHVPYRDWDGFIEYLSSFLKDDASKLQGVLQIRQ